MTHLLGQAGVLDLVLVFGLTLLIAILGYCSVTSDLSDL